MKEEREQGDRREEEIEERNRKGRREEGRVREQMRMEKRTVMKRIKGEEERRRNGTEKCKEK